MGQGAMRFCYEDVIHAPMGSVAMALDARVGSAHECEGLRIDPLTYEFATLRRGRLRITIRPVSGTSTTRVLIEEAGGAGWLARVRRRLQCRALVAELSLSARGIHRSGPPRGPQGGVPVAAERHRRLGLIPIATWEERGPHQGR
ncbi:MAG: hypothetical protein ABR541_04310 [Candidatus Dormibacteria bacterium]